MVIIGLDPGTAIIGFGVIEVENRSISVLDYGCIRTEKILSKSERLLHIRKDLEELLAQWKPQHAAVEKLFFTKNVKTGIAVAESRGVMIETLQEKNIEIAEYTPHEMKLNVCGDGSATKQGIQKMVKMLLRLEQIPKPDDAADALGIALCHAQHLPLRLLARSPDKTVTFGILS